MTSRKRKRRTIIDTAVRMSLEHMFYNNSKPSSEELGAFADKMNMEKEVCVCFCFSTRACVRAIQDFCY